MSFSELCSRYGSDKNTIHSYGIIYDKLFRNKDITSLLEIGVQNGYSIKTWIDYFKNAKITGVDIKIDTGLEYKNATLIENDAYNHDFFNSISQNKYDIIIDDGPHTLESMIFFAKYYSNLLNDNGILVIEDVQSYSWVETIISSFPPELRKYVYVVDLRHIKNRYDDILIILDLSN